MSDQILLTFTCDSEKEAQDISNLLIEQKLVACAQIFPIQSRYWWDGSVQEKTEFYVSTKTLLSHAEKIEHLICDKHSYDVPAIEIIKIDGGKSKFLNWIKETVS